MKITQSTSKPDFPLKWIFVLILFFLSCKKEKSIISENARFENNGKGFGNVSPQMVLQWNDAASYVVLTTLQIQPAPRIPPFRESHYYAMVNLAMHDALNNIVPKYKSFALNARDKDADPDAAVAQAAHDVISFFFGKLNPPALSTPAAVQTYIHALLEQSLLSIPDGEAKTKGIALGAAAAHAVISSRTNDGSATAIFPIVQGTLPGQFRSTPPFEASGFYDSPGWGDVRPFALQSSTQFPVPAPYPLTSPEYTADYNEVKAMGCVNCTGVGGRTQDQENIAKFWVESSAYGWNKVARAIAVEKNMDAWKTARLYALLQVSIADAYIACLKSKMIHFFWRPYHAIRLADTDGNPNTVADPTWQVLVFPVPPIADHPSAHAAAGGAAAVFLQDFFGTDDLNFTFESVSFPGHPRSYSSLSRQQGKILYPAIYVGLPFPESLYGWRNIG
jgi:hypothetical protein